MFKAVKPKGGSKLKTKKPSGLKINVKNKNMVTKGKAKVGY